MSDDAPRVEKDENGLPVLDEDSAMRLIEEIDDEDWDEMEKQ